MKGQLNVSPATIHLLESHAFVNREKFATTISRRLIHLNEHSHLLSATNAAENVSVAAARDEAQAIVNNLARLPQMVLPESTDTSQVTEFQNAFPEFNVTTGVNSAPHAKLQAIRKAFRTRANDHLGTRNRPVRAVGASNTEMPTINRLVHNCWPNDSGRTDYRKNNHHSPANAAHRAMTSEHNFEDCDTPTCVVGADIWSFFSAHDINPELFIRQMAAAGSDTAVIALHLPFPLLDRRVRSYTDATVGLHYEIEGDRLLVYELESGSAGYSHSFETVYSWMANMPVFEGAHVQVEVLSQIGTAVLLCLTIGKGRQEVVPNLWSCQREAFYILPELTGYALRTGERPHMSVSARRFEQLVAYVATLNPVDRTSDQIIAKLRGMLAEIRVGIHTVETRWLVIIPQLYSLV
jgi:hypothetical protein